MLAVAFAYHCDSRLVSRRHLDGILIAFRGILHRDEFSSYRDGGKLPVIAMQIHRNARNKKSDIFFQTGHLDTHGAVYTHLNVHRTHILIRTVHGARFALPPAVIQWEGCVTCLRYELRQSPSRGVRGWTWRLIPI